MVIDTSAINACQIKATAANDIILIGSPLYPNRLRPFMPRTRTRS